MVARKHIRLLELDAWRFSGAWILVLGALGIAFPFLALLKNRGVIPDT